MMNLQTQVDERIWEAIKGDYLAKQYTNAILDTIYFLSDLIREKTGLSTDGQTLVGQAFGGRSPKLKVNKFQTESELNIQKGIEHLLRGLYQSIRNPRSHGKYHDSKEDADSIILFVNYLIKVIDQSKSPFTLENFLERVFDPDFVKSSKYAGLLVDEIPNKYRFEVMVEVFRRKDDEGHSQLSFLVEALLKKLTEDEKQQLYQLISDELKITRSKTDIRATIAIFPCEYWLQIEETAKLRIENKLLQSIKDGIYISGNEDLSDGALGTWAQGLIPYASLKNDFFYLLCSKLASANHLEQDYVFQYFVSSFQYLEGYLFTEVTNIFLEGLKRGDIRFYNAFCYPLTSHDKWQDAIKDAYNKFEAKEIDLQFQAEIDYEELPF